MCPRAGLHLYFLSRTFYWPATNFFLIYILIVRRNPAGLAHKYRPLRRLSAYLSAWPSPCSPNGMSPGHLLWCLSQSHQDVPSPSHSTPHPALPTVSCRYGPHTRSQYFCFCALRCLFVHVRHCSLPILGSKNMPDICVWFVRLGFAA